MSRPLILSTVSAVTTDDDSCFQCMIVRGYELISKFNVGLKSLLHQGLSEPEFYGDLV